jgi:hypothetical protein
MKHAIRALDSRLCGWLLACMSAACSQDHPAVTSSAMRPKASVDCHECNGIWIFPDGAREGELPILEVFHVNLSSSTPAGQNDLFLVAFADGLVLLAPSTWRGSSSLDRMQASSVDVARLLDSIRNQIRDSSPLESLRYPDASEAVLAIRDRDRFCCWQVPVGVFEAAWAVPVTTDPNSRQDPQSSVVAQMPKPNQSVGRLFDKIIVECNRLRTQFPPSGVLTCHSTSIDWPAVQAPR